MKNKVSTIINVNNAKIGVLRINNDDYISLTDIAKQKNSKNPADVVIKWMSNKDSFSFYSLWEELFNPSFNFARFREIKMNEVGYNSFTMSPTRWNKDFNAIGIISSSGKYSKGTFAHPDIALEFASWIDTSFKLFLIKEFQRLKNNEAYQNQIEWNVRRIIAKSNYRIHTDAVKDKLILPVLTKEQINKTYASEADVLNVALFGMTARQWRLKNKDKTGNVRDYATIEQLIVLSNMESVNSILIREDIPQKERLLKLNGYALTQLESISKSISINQLKEIESKQLSK